MKVIFLFIDGLGIGENDVGKNPLVAAHTPHLDYIFRTFPVISTDATLGVPGLPQSATGQTAIFTGVNASQVLGRHLNGQPTETLKHIIYQNNLCMELLRRGYRVTYANVYRDAYLDNLAEQKDRRLRPSVTTVMCMACEIPFRRIADYQAGRGVYHDITGQILRDSGYDVPLITPQQAAERLYSLSREYDFTLYEHFLTDRIGHKMDMALSIQEIELLDAFLGALVEKLDLEKDTLIITSDHGNIEDATVKTHTMHPVPTIIIGRQPVDVTGDIHTLTDIMPAVLKMMG